MKSEQFKRAFEITEKLSFYRDHIKTLKAIQEGRHEQKGVCRLSIMGALDGDQFHLSAYGDDNSTISNQPDKIAIILDETLQIIIDTYVDEINKLEKEFEKL